MTLNTQSNICYNACYNRIHGASRVKPLTVLFLLLAAILGIEILITAALLYSFNRELHTASGSLDRDVFLTECPHSPASSDARRRPGKLRPHEARTSKQHEHGDSQDSRPMSECLNWEVLSGQSTQEGLMIISPEGETVVPQKGIYFVYSQVHFVSSYSRPDLQLIQYLFRRTASYPALTMLSKSGTSLRHDSESNGSLYFSHQGALFQLEKGDRLSLCVSNMDAVLLQPEATYFGGIYDRLTRA